MGRLNLQVAARWSRVRGRVGHGVCAICVRKVVKGHGQLDGIHTYRSAFFDHEISLVDKLLPPRGGLPRMVMAYRFRARR
jgi:hypothetical protein